MIEAHEIQFGTEADLEGLSCPDSISDWIERLPSDLIQIVNQLADSGFGAWVVGGCVRDALLGVPIGDIDLCSTCPPETVMEIFGTDAIPTGIEFGTVTLKGKNQHYELTTLRTEGIYRDGRRPEQVQWGTSLLEDLSRRDFTINSMAVDLARKQLYDPFNGLIDLSAHTVRAVGDPMQRCDEDGLRIFRAYRFLDRGKLGFWNLDTELHSAMQFKQPILSKVAIERKWVEFQKILTGSHAAEVLNLMTRDGALQHVLPNAQFVNPAVLSLLEQYADSSWTLKHRLAFLLIEFESEEVHRSLKKLKLPNALLKNTCEFHSFLGTVPETHSAALRVFRYCLKEDAEMHLKFQTLLIDASISVHGLGSLSGKLDDLAKKWMELEPQKTGHLCLVDGHWIMNKTGLEKGIRLGRLKQWMHRLQIEHDYTSLSEMETALSRIYWQHSDPTKWPQLRFP